MRLRDNKTNDYPALPADKCVAKTSGTPYPALLLSPKSTLNPISITIMPRLLTASDTHAIIYSCFPLEFNSETPGKACFARPPSYLHFRLLTG